MCTVSSSTQFKEMTKIQKRAVRIALQAKRNTPTIMLNEIGNIKTITHKLQEQQIKYWHKYKRAPHTMLQRTSFEKWKEYIETNDNMCKDKFGNLIINGEKFNHVINSPLSRSYLLVKSLYKPHQKLFTKKMDSVMKPPPTYTTPFPSNLHTIESQSIIDLMN